MEDKKEIVTVLNNIVFELSQINFNQLKESDIPKVAGELKTIETLVRRHLDVLEPKMTLAMKRNNLKDLN